MTKQQKRGPDPLPVKIRGQVFPTAKAAAAHFKVNISTVYHAIADGRADTIGLGRGNYPKDRRKSASAREIKIGGKTYPSMAAASKALGFHPQYIRHVMRVGKDQARARVLRAAMAASAQATGGAMKMSEMVDSSQCGSWAKQKRTV